MTASDELAMCFICFSHSFGLFRRTFDLLFFGTWAEEMNFTDRSEHFAFLCILLWTSPFDLGLSRTTFTLFLFILALPGEVRIGLL